MSKMHGFILFFLLLMAMSSQSLGQEKDNLPRVAVLSSALARDNPIMRPFDERLRKLGHIDGTSIIIDYRNAEGVLDQLDGYAAELVELDPDVIVAPGPESVLRAFRQQTRSIPIVMVAVDYDPVARGYIGGYDKPGGNITGVSIRRVEFNTKRMQLLKEMLPSVGTVALLADDFALNLLTPAEADAKALGLSLKVYHFDDPPYDFESALAAAKLEAGAVMTLASPIFFRQRHDLFAAAARHRLPVIYGVTLGVADGALMGYGPSFPAASARAADYVDRILKGADPAELPVEQSDRFDLAVNLRVARALGIEIPPSILLRANEVIE